MSPRGNFLLALGATIAATATILLTNWYVDPLALRNPRATIAVPVMENAPDAGAFWRKTLDVSRLKPATVILGRSRANSGHDGTHTGFTAALRPVYNLAMSGVSTDQIRELLVHAQHTRPLRMAIVGLDLESFLMEGRTDFVRAALSGNAESVPEWMNRLRLNLSWHALSASVGRLKGSQAVDRRQQAVPMRVVFQLAEFWNFHSRLPALFPPWRQNEEWNSHPKRAASMQAFRDMVAYARAENIDLRLFVSPVHARYLEMYQRVGWWPLFESWKRALVASLAHEAAERPGRQPFPLWDFSGFDSITTEAVPPATDPTTRMRWYLDSSHYTPEHGNLIFDRILGRPGSQDAAPAHGVLLAVNNVEAHLNKIMQDADRYRVTHNAETVEVATLATYLRGFVRRRP